jgi:hypothetical protein
MMMLNDVFLLLLLFQSLQNVQVKAFSTSSIHSCNCCNTRAFTIPASSAIICKKERQVKTCKTTLSVVTAAAKRRNIGALWTFAKGGTQEEQQSMQSMECDTENDSTHHSLSPKALSTATTFKKSPSHFLSSLQYWKKHKEEGTESLTFKQRLAKAGMSTLLSYGFVSNMSYAVTVSIAWYISAKRVGNQVYLSSFKQTVIILIRASLMSICALFPPLKFLFLHSLV